MKTRFLFGVLLTFNLFLPIGLTEVKAESNSNSDTLITKEAQAKSDTNPEIPVVDAQQWRTGKFKFPWSPLLRRKTTEPAVTAFRGLKGDKKEGLNY